MSKAAGPLLSVNRRHQGITCYRFANATRRSLIASRIDPLGSIECRRGNLCGQDAQGDRPHPNSKILQLANPGPIASAIGASEQIFGAK